MDRRQQGDAAVRPRRQCAARAVVAYLDGFDRRRIGYRFQAFAQTQLPRITIDKALLALASEQLVLEPRELPRQLSDADS